MWNRCSAKGLWKGYVAFIIICVTITTEAGNNKMEDVSFKASLDGSTQRYVLLLPENFKKSEKHDLIIGLHGHGSNRWQFAKDSRDECRAFRDFAAKHNMIAITPDYRAKTSWMGPTAESDMLDIIKKLKSEYKIKRVFLIGGSMGGSSSLTLAALHPKLLDGVTAMNPLANHLEYENFQSAISKSFGGSKKKIPAEYKKRSAEYWPERLTMPIAITVGGKDVSVPPDSVLRLADVLGKIGGKVFVVNRPGTGHSTNYEDAISALEFMFDPSKTPTATPTPIKKVANLASTKKSDWTTDEPAVKNAKGHVDLGLKFSVQKNGTLTTFRFYQGKGETGAHTLNLWDKDGKLILSIDAPEKNGPGWVEIKLPDPVSVKSGDVFSLSYTCKSNYAATKDVFKSPIARDDSITALKGVYGSKNLGQQMPTKTYKNMNYFVDVR